MNQTVRKKLAAPPEFLGASEAARVLGVTQGRVLQLLREGLIKGVKIGSGGYYVIDAAEVERYMTDVRPERWKKLEHQPAAGKLAGKR